MQQACALSEAPSASSGSWLYMLERFEIGLVHIDRELRVVGMNDYARRCPRCASQSLRARPTVVALPGPAWPR